MLTIEPTGAVLGATVRGIDLARPLRELDLGRILLALGKHGVLRFPDQHLDLGALKRVFALDMARCPWCQEGTLRIIAAITQGEVIRTILRHLKLAVDPPAMAPARVRHEACAWSSA